jgi:uncharacterized membrane protein YccC
MTEAWDLVVASDPGLVRLRMALNAAVAMSCALALEFGYAKATHAAFEGVLVAMLLGGVLAMMGSMALTGVSAWLKVRTAVFFPVAMGAGLVPGALVAGHTDAMLIVFVAVMFVAVWARRFGPAFFFYGFMFWMGYFFAAFLGANLAALPPLLGDIAIATVWTLILTLTVLRTNPRRTLRRVRRAFDARARAVARACADVLETSGDPKRPVAVRARRRLHARSLRLAEAALMIEAWSAERGALPPGWSGPMLRRRLLDAQLAIDAIADAAVTLAEQGGESVLQAARVAGHLARHEYPAVLYAARELLDAPDVPLPDRMAEVQLAGAAVDFTVLVAQAESPPTVSAASAVDYAPVVTLANGMLSGSAAVAGSLPARGRWNPLSRSSLTTRQAVQVAIAGALAIVFGRQLSETRYYWAVIATFIAFTGTATRSETSIKAFNRVLGTLVGLGAGIGLAELTAGHTLWVLVVIVASMTCGFYLVTVTYAGMIFFVTIMVAQLYSVLHEFTPGLLVLRLEETALGAAIGVAVGLLVLPTSTRDTIRDARRAFFEAMAAVLRATAARLDHGGGSAGSGGANSGGVNPGNANLPDTAALTRTLEDRMRQLALVARPLTRPLVWGVDPKHVRHRLVLYAAVARHTRALASAPERISDPAEAAALAESFRALADTALGLIVPDPRGEADPAEAVMVPAAAVDAGVLSPQEATGPAGTDFGDATFLSEPLSIRGGWHPAADIFELLTLLAGLADEPGRPAADHEPDADRGTVDCR